MKNLLRLLAVAVAITAGSAYATATLFVSDGLGNTATILDNGAATYTGSATGPATDSSGILGVVLWSGSISSVWNINIDTGTSQPVIGGPTNPQMDLNFNAISQAAGALTLRFTDSGFTSVGSFLDSIGGTQMNLFGDSVVDHILVNGQIVMTLGPFTGAAFSGSTTTGLSLSSTDVVTLEVIITHGAGLANQTTGNKAWGSVPDGGSSVALLGLALAGVGILRRRLNRV